MIVLEKILSDTRTEQEVAKELCDNFDVNILEMFIIRPLIEEVHAGTVHAINPFRLLYEILCEDKEQRICPKLVYEITDILFEDSDAPFDVFYMKRITEGQYGRWVFNRILFGFRDSVSEGSPRYVYSAAAVMALQWEGEGLDVIDTATNCFLEGIELGGKLLGIAAFSLVCRNRLCFGYMACPNGYLHADEMTDAFVRCLTEKYDYLYPYIVTTIGDLVLLGAFDTRILMNSALVQATVDALEDSALGAYAEGLLSLLPQTCKVDAPEVRAHYDEVYEEIFKLGNPGKLLQIFRVEMRLHCWDAVQTLAEWKRLTIRLGEVFVFTSNSHDRRLIELFRYTNCELMAHFHGEWLTATPEFALHALLAPLPAERKEYLEKLADELSQNTCYVIDDAETAAEITTYCQNSVSELEGYDLQKASALMHRTKLCCGADEGTAIAVRWFYLLCRLGDGPAGIGFYNTHREILDRPFTYKSTFAREEWLGQEIGDMAAFLQRDSRLIRGIKMAQMSGNDSIMSTFREMAARENNQVLLEAIGAIKKGIDAGTDILEELRHENMSKEPLWGFDFYYDDMGSALQTMRSNPITHPVIIGFGYGGIKDVVLDAVYDCGIGIMRTLPYAPVRQDKDVLLEAMLVIGLELNDE